MTPNQPKRHRDILEDGTAAPDVATPDQARPGDEKSERLIGRLHGVQVRPVQRAIRGDGVVRVKRIDPEGSETPNNGKVYTIPADKLPDNAKVEGYTDFLRYRFELSEEILGAALAEAESNAPNARRAARRRGGS